MDLQYVFMVMALLCTAYGLFVAAMRYPRIKDAILLDPAVKLERIQSYVNMILLALLFGLFVPFVVYYIFFNVMILANQESETMNFIYGVFAILWYITYVWLFSHSLERSLGFFRLRSQISKRLDG